MSGWKSPEEVAAALDRILREEAEHPMPLPENTFEENVAFNRGVEHARAVVRNVIADPVCNACERPMSRHLVGGRDEECPWGFSTGEGD